jgi:hypothetical protein
MNVETSIFHQGPCRLISACGTKSCRFRSCDWLTGARAWFLFAFVVLGTFASNVIAARGENLDAFLQRETFADCRDKPFAEIVAGNDQPPPTSPASTRSSTKTLKLMTGATSTHTWVIVDNPLPWPEMITMVWAGPSPSFRPPSEASSNFVVENVGSRSSASVNAPSQSWEFLLPAESTVAWNFEDKLPTLRSWNHRVEARTLASLDSDLNRLNQALTQLTHFQPLEVSVDGSFEEETESSDSLPESWVYSMSPSAEWSKSSENARTGATCLMVVNHRADSKSWLQSPPIDLLANGRLSASLWFRVEAGQSLPAVNASTTLFCGSADRYEWKHRIPESEMSRCTTSWQRIDFPILTEELIQTADQNPGKRYIRFTLDVEAATQLYVDDFSVYRVLLDEDERRQLRSELFVARRELNQNQPMAAWELTRSERFQFVTEKAPPLPSPQFIEANSQSTILNRTNRTEPRKGLFDGNRRRIR